MATTTNWALPYPVSTATPDVPRDILALANQVDSALSSGVHEQVIGNYSFSAQNTFTNVTAPADFPIAADAAALTMSFTKFSASTKLILSVSGSAQLSAGVQQALLFSIAIGATNYDTARFTFPAAGGFTRYSWSGTRAITGIAAGTYTIKLRFYAATASQVDFFPGGNGDSVSYSVREIS